MGDLLTATAIGWVNKKIALALTRSPNSLTET